MNFLPESPDYSWRCRKNDEEKKDDTPTFFIFSTKPFYQTL